MIKTRSIFAREEKLTDEVNEYCLKVKPHYIVNNAQVLVYRYRFMSFDYRGSHVLL